jgi:hypothetical protein
MCKSCVFYKKKLKISNAEYDAMVHEIGEKITDLIYGGHFEDKLKHIHPKREFEQWVNDLTEVSFSYTFSLVPTDIYQILMRLRRTNESKPR